MAIRRIILLIKTPFCKRDYERFGVKGLTDKGFAVEVWDFTPFIRPRLSESVAPPDPIDFKSCRIFNTQDEATKAIHEISRDTYVVLMLKFDRASYSIFRALNKNKTRYGVIIGKGLPIPDDQAKMSRLMAMLKKAQKKFSSPHKIFRTLCLSPWFPSELVGIRSPSQIFMRCGKTDAEAYPMSPRTEIVRSHMFDYDLYLEKKLDGTGALDPDAGRSKRLAVFLDGNVAFANDALDSAFRFKVTADVFYPLIRDFFERLEKENNIKVAVAAHPRSHYDEHPEYYGDRTVVRGKTIEMVREADFVIAQASTSTGFAVLFGKPLMFVTTDQHEQGDDGQYIGRLASLLDKKPINISTRSTIDLEKDLTMNDKAYQQYINDYIKVEGSPDIPFWEIFANKIKEL